MESTLSDVIACGWAQPAGDEEQGFCYGAKAAYCLLPATTPSTTLECNDLSWMEDTGLDVSSVFEDVMLPEYANMELETWWPKEEMEASGCKKQALEKVSKHSNAALPASLKINLKAATPNDEHTVISLKIVKIHNSSKNLSEVSSLTHVDHCPPSVSVPQMEPPLKHSADLNLELLDQLIECNSELDSPFSPLLDGIVAQNDENLQDLNIFEMDHGTENLMGASPSEILPLMQESGVSLPPNAPDRQSEMTLKSIMDLDIADEILGDFVSLLKTEPSSPEDNKANQIWCPVDSCFSAQASISSQMESSDKIALHKEGDSPSYSFLSVLGHSSPPLIVTSPSPESPALCVGNLHSPPLRVTSPSPESPGLCVDNLHFPEELESVQESCGSPEVKTEYVSPSFMVEPLSPISPVPSVGSIQSTYHEELAGYSVVSSPVTSLQSSVSEACEMDSEEDTENLEDGDYCFPCKRQNKRKRTSKRGQVSKPYSKRNGREKKKEQNKRAALRYRQKKKEEQHLFYLKLQSEEEQNKKLKQEHQRIKHELFYTMKLVRDMLKADGIKPASSSKLHL